MKGVSVEIMGRSLVVVSDQGDDWVRAVAEAVDDKIRHIRADSNAASSINLAILAALNFADELRRMHREHRGLVERIEELNKRLSAVIETPDFDSEPDAAGKTRGETGLQAGGKD